jgi:hypothetical protein
MHEKTLSYERTCSVEAKRKIAPASHGSRFDDIASIVIQEGVSRLKGSIGQQIGNGIRKVVELPQFPGDLWGK